MRSRAWGAAVGCSYRIERCSVVKVWITILHSFPSVLSGIAQKSFIFFCKVNNFINNWNCTSFENNLSA